MNGQCFLATFRRLGSFPVICLAVLLMLAGCGDSVPSAGSLRQAKGKVIFSTPSALAGLKIEFLPNSGEARPASGDIKPDGTFELTTTTPGDGVSDGMYKVRLSRGLTAKGKPVASPIPSQYFDEDGAYLSATIKSDTTEIPAFDLKPIAGAAGVRGKATRDND